MKPLERVGICCADSSESFWWDAGQQPHCPGCPIDSETYEEHHEFFVVEARLGRAAEQLQKLYDLAGIAHHRILSSEQGLDEESKRLGNALVATRDLLDQHGQQKQHGNTSRQKQLKRLGGQRQPSKAIWRRLWLSLTGLLAREY